jgi:hypothetical protein
MALAQPQIRDIRAIRGEFPHGCSLAGRSKTSGSPREGTRPTRFSRKSICIVGPVPSPGVFLNGLLGGECQHIPGRQLTGSLNDAGHIALELIIDPPSSLFLCRGIDWATP